MKVLKLHQERKELIAKKRTSGVIAKSLHRVGDGGGRVVIHQSINFPPAIYANHNK